MRATGATKAADVEVSTNLITNAGFEEGVRAHQAYANDNRNNLMPYGNIITSDPTRWWWVRRVSRQDWVANKGGLWGP